jgi:hypothetical protein
MGDYEYLIQTNPIVPYAMDGWRKSHWCNYFVLMDTPDNKNIQIRVFANTPREAIYYAKELKNYLENHPMSEYGKTDHVSVAVMFPVYDQESEAYVVRLNVLIGNLLVMGGGKDGQKQYLTNQCITTASSGIEQGFEYNHFGSAKPAHTVGGLRFYCLKWVTNGSSDEVTIKFGDAGDEKLGPDVDILVVDHKGAGYFADWRDADKAYVISDQTLVNKLVFDGNTTEQCFYFGALPNIIVNYDFNMERGDEEC